MIDFEIIDILLDDLGYVGSRRYYDAAQIEHMPNRDIVPHCNKTLRKYTERFAADKLEEPLEALMNYDL